MKVPKSILLWIALALAWTPAVIAIEKPGADSTALPASTSKDTTATATSSEDPTPTYSSSVTSSASQTSSESSTSPDPSKVDLDFLNDAHLPYEPVLCDAPDFCFYCPLAATVGGPFYVNHANKKPTQYDVNQVGLKCLKSLYQSPYGLFMNDYDYVALGVVDSKSEQDATYLSLAKSAQKKAKLVDNLVCPRKGQYSKQDNDFCSVCADLESPECKHNLKKLCKEGYSSSGHQYRTSYNHNANFLWKQLNKDAPRVCEAVLSGSSYKTDYHFVYSSLARSIVDHCESDRRYKPCKASYKTPQYKVSKHGYHEPKDAEHKYLPKHNVGTYKHENPYKSAQYEQPKGYTHSDSYKSHEIFSREHPYDAKHPTPSEQHHYGSQDDHTSAYHKASSHEHLPYESYNPKHKLPYDEKAYAHDAHLNGFEGYGHDHHSYGLISEAHNIPIKDQETYKLPPVHVPYQKYEDLDPHSAITHTSHKEEWSPHGVPPVYVPYEHTYDAKYPKPLEQHYYGSQDDYASENYKASSHEHLPYGVHFEEQTYDAKYPSSSEKHYHGSQDDHTSAHYKSSSHEHLPYNPKHKLPYDEKAYAHDAHLNGFEGYGHDYHSYGLISEAHNIPIKDQETYKLPPVHVPYQKYEELDPYSAITHTSHKEEWSPHGVPPVYVPYTKKKVYGPHKSSSYGSNHDNLYVDTKPQYGPYFQDYEGDHYGETHHQPSSGYEKDIYSIQESGFSPENHSQEHEILYAPHSDEYKPVDYAPKDLGSYRPSVVKGPYKGSYIDEYSVGPYDTLHDIHFEKGLSTEGEYYDGVHHGNKAYYE